MAETLTSRVANALAIALGAASPTPTDRSVGRSINSTSTLGTPIGLQHRFGPPQNPESMPQDALTHTQLEIPDSTAPESALNQVTDASPALGGL